MSVAAGTRLGPYEVIGLLGKGGMGEVYHARDTRLGRKVALKVLSADFTQNEDRVKRFQQEARAASALNHPNIITIYDVGEIDSSHFIATEFIEGETLRQRIKSSEIALLEVLDISIQAATALAAAHSATIMHRDIKPEDIMLRADGYVKVLDFGLAKLTEATGGQESSKTDPEAETQSMVNTKPGTVMGTVSYMSPEQAQGLSLDVRTDIFSLGVVIYEMIAGRVPFEGNTPSEVIAGILRKRPLPLARFALDVPPELERIVSKALGKNRDERYQTIKDLLIDLRRLKQQLEIEAEIQHSGQADWSLPRVSVTSSSGGSGTGSSGQEVTAIAGVANNSSTKTQELISASRNMSSAEYLITEIKRRKKTVLITMAALVVIAIGALYMTAGSREIDSIAVMPFTSERTDPNIRHISDAVTQRIINGLSSRLPNIRVRPFSAVSRYNGNQPDPQSISKDLGVRAVLTGSISKREGDDSVFISVELVDADDNSLIWGERYDSKFADIRRVQENILKGVFAKLGPKLSEEEKRRREAEDLYLEARTHIDKRTTRSLREAVRLLEQAIAKDPNYAPSYAGMADCYDMLSIYGAEPPVPGFTKAKESAQKALSLDNSLAEAHTALAFALFRFDWDWEGSEGAFQRAIKLNPDYGQAYQWYSNCLTALGRFAEAEQQTRRAQELDPTSLIIQAHFGFTYYFAGRYDDVIEAGQKAIRLDPNFFAVRRYMGLAYTQQGKYAEAIAEFQKAVDASGGSWVMKAELGHALAASGDKAGAQKIIDELIGLSSQRYVSPYSIATIYAGMGDRDKAFEWINRAYEERADFLAYFKVDPRYKEFRGDPRYEEIIRKIGLN